MVVEARTLVFLVGVALVDKLRCVRDSTTPCSLAAARDGRESARVSRDGFGEGPAVDELPFAPARDQPGLAQNLEMVRYGGGSHPAHRNDVATVHAIGGREGLEDPQA